MPCLAVRPGEQGGVLACLSKFTGRQVLCHALKLQSVEKCPFCKLQQAPGISAHSRSCQGMPGGRRAVPQAAARGHI